MLKNLEQVTPALFRYLVKENRRFFSQQLKNLNNELRADQLFIAGLNDELTEACTLVMLSNNQITDNFTYPLKHSPCEKVLDNALCRVDSGVANQFPHDLVLQKMSIEGYIGVPIINADDNPLGIIVGLYREQQDNLMRHQFAFSLCASFIHQVVQKNLYSHKLNAQLTLLKKVEEIALTGAWEYHVASEKLFWSEQVYRIHALPIDTELTLSLAASFYSGKNQERINSLFENALRKGSPYHVDLQITDAQGDKKWIRTSGEPELNPKGEVTRIYGAIEDITSEYALLADLQYNNTRLNSILDNLNDAVITINTQGIIEHTNAVASSMFGYQADELKGQTVNILMPEPYASQHDRYMAHYLKTGDAKIIGVGRQLPGKRKNGDIFQMELALTEAICDGEAEYIGIIRDISERIKAQDTIYNLAYTDPISGVKNRRWFEKECKDLILRARLQEHFVCAALIDIDKMSQFNLKYGFVVGNDAIKQIAGKLAALSTPEIRLYKSGADSFILLNLLTQSKETAQNNKTKWLVDFLEADNFKIEHQGKEISLSASLGSCICDAQCHTFESILDTLEHTVREAKRRKPFGRYFIDEAGIRAYERIKKIRSALETITESGEIFIVLQPQYRDQETICSSEALIRWQSRELGFISPADFIPLAEESDAIIKIGDWVLEQVCRLLAKTQSEGIYTRISVNISGKQIVSPDFKSKLMDKIDRYQIAPEQILLELTETTLVSDIDLVKNIMLSMKEAGFHFSIDDFGTGYSSLNYLKELPISELKIDKHFVDDILDSQEGAVGKIVNLIIDMAKILDVYCVAEGVETAEQVDFLSARNCALYQGYFFSKPLGIDEWQQLIDSNYKKIATSPML